jgi:hypothetical protein
MVTRINLIGVLLVLDPKVSYSPALFVDMSSILVLVLDT